MDWDNEHKLFQLLTLILRHISIPFLLTWLPQNTNQDVRAQGSKKVTNVQITLPGGVGTRSVTVSG